MIATLTNTSGLTLNKVAAYDNSALVDGRVATVATGGALENPLPHPFDKVGEIANGDAVVRAMHIGDFRKPHNRSTALEPGEELTLMINRGDITISYAAETGRSDAEENFDSDIV